MAVARNQASVHLISLVRSSPSTPAPWRAEPRQRRARSFHIRGADAQRMRVCVLLTRPFAQRGVQRKEPTSMNWDRIEGNWKQFTGKAKQQWGKLTDDDLTVVQGRRTELIGKIQERYGVARDEAEKQVDTWTST